MYDISVMKTMSYLHLIFLRFQVLIISHSLVTISASTKDNDKENDIDTSATVQTYFRTPREQPLGPSRR